MVVEETELLQPRILPQSLLIKSHLNPASANRTTSSSSDVEPVLRCLLPYLIPFLKP